MDVKQYYTFSFNELNINSWEVIEACRDTLGDTDLLMPYKNRAWYTCAGELHVCKDNIEGASFISFLMLKMKHVRVD